MELLAMGEYGPFVWSSYFLALIVVIVSAIQARQRHRQIATEYETVGSYRHMGSSQLDINSIPRGLSKAVRVGRPETEGVEFAVFLR